MRVWPGVFLLVAACSSPPSPQPLTAESFRSDFIASFVTPTPATIAPGLDLPLHPGDRVIGNCAQTYAYELPEMTIDEQREFNASVICVYPDPAKFDASMRHYLQALRERGFEDDSGTYVQSGMRIACNRTHSVVMSLKSRFIPPFAFDEATGEHIDIPGGGELANSAILFGVSDRPCERFRGMEAFSEPPPPENYAALPQPLFLDPPPAMKWGAYELPLRPGDRLVSHCAQYYRDEMGERLPPDATPNEFARLNQLLHCIYVPQDDVAEAVAHYLATLEAGGFNRRGAWAEPDPSASAPSLRAGVHEWTGAVARCDAHSSVVIGAMARHGPTVMMDAETGEFWSKLGPSGGRAAKLDTTDYPNRIVTIRFGSLGCG